MYEESIDSFDEEALEAARQRERDRRNVLLQEVDFERCSSLVTSRINCDVYVYEANIVCSCCLFGGEPTFFGKWSEMNVKLYLAV